MKKSVRVLGFLFCMAIAFHAKGMTLEKQGSELFATGTVGGEDWLKFNEALTDPVVNTVVLVNSPGGDLWAAIAVSKLISDRGYKTVVAGSCSSACALIFMGGKERRFSSAFAAGATYVGIHGAHSRDNGSVVAQANPEMFALLKSAMGQKFNAGIVNTALYAMDDAGALLVVPDHIRNPRVSPYHCKSAQTLSKDCTPYPSADALSLGVITHNDLVTLALPAAFRPSTALLGRAQAAPLADLRAYLDAIGQEHCQGYRCKDGVTALLAEDDDKALAVPEAGSGASWSYKQPSLIHAVLTAVYACNHPQDQPARLCTAVMANGFDLRHFYAEAEGEHRSAFAQLQIPSAKFYASEAYGGGFGSVHAYRFDKPFDVPPMQIDGVETIGTQALARMLKSGAPPTVIDVGGTNGTVPTASTLFVGGNAYEDPALEAAFNDRFTALLKLLAPDADRALVMLGAGRDWLSVNAALRARHAGYSHVFWYRGGMEAWKSANLPSALTTVRAVVD